MLREQNPPPLRGDPLIGCGAGGEPGAPGLPGRVPAQCVGVAKAAGGGCMDASKMPLGGSQTAGDTYKKRMACATLSTPPKTSVVFEEAIYLRKYKNSCSGFMSRSLALWQADGLSAFPP